jgi:ornithine cyclodeaminase/alanine dehydrogenase-like protein (mu-crystallin family)
MRLFTDEHVAELSWDDVLSALRAAFSDPGEFAMADRVMLPAPGEGAFLTMPCASADGWFGVKQASVLPRNPQRGLPSVQAWYTLLGPDGSPALAGPATLLTRLRTSAVSAVAADVLAPQAARNLLIVGTGSLAPWMARAHLQVRAFETVWVWGRRPERAEAVVTEVLQAFEGRAFRPAVAVADDLESAARQADVISLATTSSQPLLEGAWVSPGQHLDLVGAFLPSMREVDEAAVMACDVFVDQREAARHEAGDLHHAAAAGWSWSEIRGDLHELVRGAVGRQPGRPTLFKSVGLALEDLVVARLLAP